jgi:GT2 family glycosyltransferase
VTAAPNVAVVMLHWGATASTSRCLQSLRTATWPGRRTVFVVDNQSSLDDDLGAGAMPLDMEILRPGRNLGFAEGCTLGIAAAIEQKADFVLLLNNDVVVEPDFLGPLVRALGQRPDAGLASPQIVHLDRPDEAWYQGGTFSLWTGIPVQGNRRPTLTADHPPREVDYATGCAMLIRPAVIERVGSFDARFFAYCEDVDLSVRGRQAGFRVLFVPASVVHHDVRADPGRAVTRIYYSTRNLIEVMRKHARWYRWFSFGASFLVRWVGFFAVQALVQRRPRYLAALGWGVLDSARRRFGPNPRIDGAGAERTALAPIRSPVEPSTRAWRA